MKSSKSLQPIVWIVPAALVLRVAWVLWRWRQAGPAFEFADEKLHWQLAWNLVHDGVLVSDDGRYVARMPGYPLFLSLFAWIGQAGVLAARLAQCLAGTLAVWLGGRIADAHLGRRAGIVAATLLALDPYTIFFCNLLLTEIPFLLIGVAMVRSSLPLMIDPGASGRRHVTAVAILGALAITTRPSSAGWIVLLWVVLLLCDRRRARAAARVGVCVGVLAIGLLPWGLRNRSVVGDFAWLSANGGLTLYDAQGPQADGSSDQSFLDDMPELRGLGEVDRDRRLGALAIKQMRANPARVVRLAGTKFLRTWSLTPNVAEYRYGATAITSALFSGLVLVGAAAGLWRCARGRPALMVALWLPVVYFTLVHCVFIGSLRYRIPIMPFVEITAAAAVVRRTETP